MTLTESQLKAIHSKAHTIAVVANAGSGKTRVLTERIAALVKDENVPPHQILAFTFTEKAAEEIRHRVVSTGLLTREAEVQLTIGTMHAFFLSGLKKYGILLGLSPDFRVMDETEACIKKSRFVTERLKIALHRKETIGRAATQYGFNRLLGLVERLMEEEDLFLKETNRQWENGELLQFARQLQADFLNQKIKAAALTFNDLERLFLEVLRRFPETRWGYQSRYRHILVDEFQDTSPIQGEIIEHLHHPEKNTLFIVGDPKQSIYRFRRADVSLFGKTMARIRENGGEIIALSDTFRLAPPLVEAVNRVFHPLMGEENALLPYEPMTVGRKDGQGTLTITALPRSREFNAENLREMEAHAIAQDVLSDRGEKTRVVLFRSGSPIPLFKRILTQAGISVHVDRSDFLLHTPEIRDAIHWLKAIGGSRHRLVMAGILRGSFFSFSEAFIEHLFSLEWDDLFRNASLGLFVTKPDLHEWEKLVYFKERWTRLAALFTPSQLMAILWDDLEKDGRLHAHAALSRQQWVLTLKTLEEGDKRLKESALRHKLLCDEIDALLKEERYPKTVVAGSPKPMVTLMTIHGSKGLEFDKVYLPQLHASGPPHSIDFLFDIEKGLALKMEGPEGSLKPEWVNSPLLEELRVNEDMEEREETKRLLYVAMTRAKSELVLFLKEADEKKRKKLSETGNPGEWLTSLLADKMRGETTMSVGTRCPAPRARSSAPLQQTTRFQYDARTRRSHYSVSELECFLRCEKEYELRYQWGLTALPALGSNAEEKTLKAFDWGQFVHEAFQFLDWQGFTNLDTVVEQALVNQEIKDEEGLYKARLLKSIEKLHNAPEILSLLKASGAQTETPFVVNMEGFTVSGVLDRLVEIDGVWTVIDYKTDKLKNELELENRIQAYHGQMTAYAVTLMLAKGVDQVNTALIFTELPKAVVKTWGKEDLMEGVKTLQALHEKLSTFHPVFSHPKTASNCFHCAFLNQNACRVKTIHAEWFSLFDKAP